jgi:Na+-driven multidrug efflux pump
MRNLGLSGYKHNFTEGENNAKTIFYTDPVFNIAAIGICPILIVLYTVF